MKNKRLWIVICLVLLLGILLTAVLLGKAPKTPEATPADSMPTTQTTPSSPTEETEETTTIPTGETVQEQQTTPSLPQELPPVVELPVETDPATGESKGIPFPATVEGYQLVIEKLAPYDGMFVEDGSNAPVEGVAMLLLKNAGDYPIEYAELTVEYESATLVFHVSALPVGARLVAQEKNAQPVPEGQPTACRALIVQRGDMTLSETSIKITENADNSITVTNLTKEMIPTVRVFYKYYLQDQNIYVGGIAFTVRLTRLGAGSSVTVRPAHYTAASGKVVMALTYEQEV